jgi:hypothetical protein
MQSPSRRDSTTGELSVLLAVGGTVQGASGYYAVPGKALWQYWTFDEDEGWELITDQVEPIPEDSKAEDELMQVGAHSSGFVVSSHARTLMWITFHFLF